MDAYSEAIKAAEGEDYYLNRPILLSIIFFVIQTALQAIRSSFFV